MQETLQHLYKKNSELSDLIEKSPSMSYNSCLLVVIPLSNAWTKSTTNLDKRVASCQQVGTTNSGVSCEGVATSRRDDGEVATCPAGSLLDLMVLWEVGFGMP